MKGTLKISVFVFLLAFSISACEEDVVSQNINLETEKIETDEDYQPSEPNEGYIEPSSEPEQSTSGPQQFTDYGK